MKPKSGVTYSMWSHIGEDDPSTRLWCWVSTTLPEGFGPWASVLSLPHWWGCLPYRGVTRWLRDRKSLYLDTYPLVSPQVLASNKGYLGTVLQPMDISTWWQVVANEEFSWQERLLFWGLSCGLALFPTRIEVCMPSKEEENSQL
jgi:hypothetical protein